MKCILGKYNVVIETGMKLFRTESNTIIYIHAVGPSLYNAENKR